MSEEITLQSITECLEERKGCVDTIEDRHRLRDIRTMIIVEFGEWNDALTTEQITSVIEQAFILGNNISKKD